MLCPEKWAEVALMQCPGMGTGACFTHPALASGIYFREGPCLHEPNLSLPELFAPTSQAPGLLERPLSPTGVRAQLGAKQMPPSPASGQHPLPPRQVLSKSVSANPTSDRAPVQTSTAQWAPVTGAMMLIYTSWGWCFDSTENTRGATCLCHYPMEEPYLRGTRSTLQKSNPGVLAHCPLPLG